MKVILTVVSLLLSGVVSEPPAPYPPSGWRPSGPAFELPTKSQTQPQIPQYLPPVDPRNPSRPTEFDVGADVSVQGLPTEEQLPIFEVSPVNGQQYVGPKFNNDINSLQQNLQQSQYQLQQEKAVQFSRQQQFPANPNAASGLPNQQSPRQFVPQTTPATTTTPRTKQAEPTTASSKASQVEKFDEDAPQKKTSVEVSKQNIQEYPPELFLSPLAQLQYQPQFLPLQQFGQIRQPVLYQPVQQNVPEKQVVAGFDGPAHFAALPSVLAQKQIASQQQTLIPPQRGFIQSPALIISRAQEQPASPIIVPAVNGEPLPQYQPVINSQYQPLPQSQVQAYPQLQPQPVILQQGQVEQFQQNQNVQSNQQEVVDERNTQEPPQFYQQTYTPQELQQQSYQPQEVQPSYQPQQIQPSYQPQEIYQPQFAAQPQIPVNQYVSPAQQNVFLAQGQQIGYQNPDYNQFYQVPQQQFITNQYDVQPIAQGQEGSLQSGLDINQQGNDIDQIEDKEQEPADEEEQDEGTKATAVATAFGARTQPRVFSQYGVPNQVPRVQARPNYQTTTESTAEDTTEDEPAVAQASAVATGSRNRSAKLRSRRPRPLFTVDRSGHLVVAREQ